MAERVGRKSIWSSLSRFEQVTLASTVLIWAGVLLFGAGLYIAIRNRGMEQAAYVQATSIASTSYPTRAAPSSTVPPTAQPPTATPAPTSTPSPTPIIYPAGWSTATPTPTSTPRPTAEQPASTSTRAPTPTAATPATTRSHTSSAQGSQTVSKPSTLASKSAMPSASEPPQRLVIPAIDLDSPVIPVAWNTTTENGIEYSVWEVADRVVGWHRTSAYPGHGDNVVLNGHHNIRGEVFRYLVDLEVGDLVLVYAGKQVYHYAVSEKHILKEKGEPASVRKENASWIAPTGDERVTMVTCWPYTNNTHRLVVVARPIPPPQIGNLER